MSTATLPRRMNKAQKLKTHFQTRRRRENVFNLAEAGVTALVGGGVGQRHPENRGALNASRGTGGSAEVTPLEKKGKETTFFATFRCFSLQTLKLA